jgi:hypothetical protein
VVIEGCKDVDHQWDRRIPGFSVHVVWFTPTRESSPRQPVSTVDALRQVLAPYQNHERLCIFLDRDDFQSGGVWVNITGDRAQVSYFTMPGDVGSYCCDPEYSSPDEMVGFLLSNGQLDHYHRYWTITRADTIRALEYFLQHGERDPGLNWVTDPRSLQEPA